MKEEYLHQELTRNIIGAAMKVLNELGPSLDEKVYENALILELIAGGHRVEQQRQYPIHYRNHLVGTLIPDLLVDDAVIVDPKVATAFNEDHFAQMIGYLAIAHLEVALLLNFKFARLQWKRVVRTNRPSDPDLHATDDRD
jgi:GxxExxY protein